MLEIRNVTKVYRSKTGEEVRALDNVSITFPESGMVFILGKSGSGKSTLLNVMGGLDSYDSGEFIIKGKSSNDFVGSDFDAYRNTFIGFIFQEYNVLDDFTVGANIGLALELQGKKATEEKIGEILDSVDLLNYAQRKPNELSGGQKQRVAIARALVKEPQIIMADEPTGALDSNTGKQIFDTLKALSKEKLVLIVSHDRDFAERYADRIIEMADGQVIEDVTKHEHHAEKISEGVHRINDNILRIEGGYKLTAADLEMINAYLAKSHGDVLLSGDGRVNDELRSAAGISRDGSTTVFEGTKPEQDIKTKKYQKDETKFIRSKLPMKNAVKMGASGLRHKKFRLFMTVLLSFISFAMFGLSSSMAAYEKVNAATHSIIDSEIRSAAMTLGVRRTTTFDDGDSYTSHDGQGFNEDDIKWLKEQTGLEFVPVFTGYSSADRYSSNNGGFDVSHMMNNYESNTVYTAKIAGMVNMTLDKLPADYRVVGRLPENAGEIALTEFMYRQFKQYGFKTADGETISGNDLTMLGDGSENDLIGKTLTIDQIGWQNVNFEFEIVGIVNTNFNYDRYANLMPADQTQQQQQQVSGVQEEPSLMDLFLTNEIKYERDFGFHGLAFAHAEDIEEMTAYMAMNGYGGEETFNKYMSGYNGNLGFYIYKPAAVAGDDPELITNFQQVSTSASALGKLDRITWITGTPKTELAENEILLPMYRVGQLLESADPSLDWTDFEQILATKFPEMMTEYNAQKTNSHDRVRIAADAYAMAYSTTTDAFYENTDAQAAILALFDLPTISNMSAKGVRKLSDLINHGNLSYNTVQTAVSSMMIANFVIENEYHKEANTDSAFVKWYRTRDQHNTIQPSEWKAMTDDQRLDRLVSDCWLSEQYPAKYDMELADLYEYSFNMLLAITGRSMSDVTAAIDGFVYKLMEVTHGDGGETRTEYKTLENISVVGFFTHLDDQANYMFVSDLAYNEWKTWYEAQQEDMYKDNNMPTYQEERAEHTSGKWAFVLAPISASNTTAIEKLVQLSYSDPETTDLLFEMQNAVMYTLGSFNEIIEVLAQVFVWVGLGLALFSSFLLMNFIATSISYKKRDIGILRAVGARSSDVFKIFFSEAFIIAIINFVLAVGASVAAVMVLNWYMRNSGINITLLTFGPLQVAIMLGVSFLVAVLASFLPVRSIARKKPVDAIKDR